MAFHVMHRLGTMEDEPQSVFPALLRELEEDPEDREHNSVAVTHESEWCLEVLPGGYVIFQNLEDGEPRHMADVPSDKIIALWHLLAEGDLDALEREPWQSKE